MQIKWLNNWVSHFFQFCVINNSLLWSFRCLIAASASVITHSAASLLVVQWPDRSRPAHWTAHGTERHKSMGQLHRPGALLTHSCQAAIVHYWLLSGLTAPSLPPSPRKVDLHVAKTCCLGRERHCDDQVTEAHSSNAHLVANERSLSFLSYTVTKTSIKQ